MLGPTTCYASLQQTDWNKQRKYLLTPGTQESDDGTLTTALGKSYGRLLQFSSTFHHAPQFFSVEVSKGTSMF